MTILYGIIMILIGTLTLFFGVKIFRIWLALNGGILGWALGAQIGELLNCSTTFSMVLTIGVAILCALLIYALYKIGFVLSGALLVALLVSAFSGYFEAQPDWVYYTVLAGGAVLGGFLAWKFFRPYLIIATSLYGAYIGVLGVYGLITGQQMITVDGLAPMVLDMSSLAWYLYAAILIFTVFGIVFQIKKYGLSDGKNHTYHAQKK